jgi:hypothetical protein
MKKIYNLLLLVVTLLSAGAVIAGNPDRQGEAGASQLLINPWARSAGLHSLNTASIKGTEAMFLNVAGLGRIKSTEINIGHTRYMEGAGLGLNALALARRIGKGAFGISLVSMDLGDLDFTTENTPGGSGTTFSPSFVNVGLSYSHVFDNKVSVGVTAKMVSESATSVAARAIALDAGVQYVTGENDEFKFGISLRNVGGKMRFAGEGLSAALPNPGPNFPYNNVYYNRSSPYELPSQLNIGASYDFLFGKSAVLAVLGNFTSNAFARDQAGVGAEFRYREFFALRAAYKYEFNSNEIERTLDNGLAAGFSFAFGTKKGSNTRFALDYAYRSTFVFRGTHNLGIRVEL